MPQEVSYSTGEGITVIAPTAVLAPNVWGFDDRLIVSLGTTRDVEASSVTITEITTALSDITSLESDVSDMQTDLSAAESDIDDIEADYVSASGSFGLDRLIIGVGVGRQVAASGIDAGDVGLALSTYVSTAGGFSNDGRLVTTLSGTREVEESTIAVSDLLTLLSSNLTIYVATTGNDTTGDGTSGNPYATVNRALEDIVTLAPQIGVTITISVAAGIYSGHATITIPACQASSALTVSGASTSFTGATTTGFGSLTNDGDSDYIDVDVTLASGSATVGEYMRIDTSTGGTNPAYMFGVHEVVGVAGSVITVRVRRIAGVAALPSGTITVGGIILNVVMANSGVSGVLMTGVNGASVSDIMFANTGSKGSTRGVDLQSTNCTLTRIGVSNYFLGMEITDNSTASLQFVSIAYCGGTNAAGIRAYRGATISSGGLTTFNGNVGSGTGGNDVDVRASNFVLGNWASNCSSSTPIFCIVYGTFRGEAATVVGPVSSTVSVFYSSIMSDISSSGSVTTDYAAVSRTTGGGSFNNNSVTHIITTSNTDTSAVSYERLQMYFSGGLGRIETTVGPSGGTARDLVFGRGGTEQIRLGSAGPIVNNNGASDIDFRVEGVTADALLFCDASANRVALGGTAAAPANVFYVESGVGVVVNEAGGDIDFRAEGDTATQLFVIDAGLDSVRIGTTTAGRIADFTPTVINFNSNAEDIDFFVNGDTATALFRVDAGADAVYIGTTTQGAIAAMSAAAVVFNELGDDRDFRVESDGLTHALTVDAGTNNLVFLTSGTPNFQSMTGGIFIGNGTAIPTGNPTGGGFLYVEAGALKWRGSSGTVTTLGPA